jgi:hypothetical protein
MDVTPTGLYCMGLDVPPGLDGRVVTEMFRPEHLAASPPRMADVPPRLQASAPAPPDGEGEGDVMGRLRDLGYL